MPRSKSDQPGYRYHISGQAVVTFPLNGGQKNFCLGEHGSKESRAKYFALLAEYQATGTINLETATHQADHPITVQAVTAEYRRHIKVKYARSPHHERHMRNLCTTIEDGYGDTAACEFGPIKLAELRDLFVASGNNRNYANTQTRSVIQIFRHAVSRELIPVSVVETLKTLEPLRSGQTRAPEAQERDAVPLEAVAATVEQLSPTLRAMVSGSSICSANDAREIWQRTGNEPEAESKAAAR